MEAKEILNALREDYSLRDSLVKKHLPVPDALEKYMPAQKEKKANQLLEKAA